MKTFFINDQNVASYADEIAVWIKTKVEQAHQKGVVTGMSGGIDCSVVARLCQWGGVDVQLILMPYGNDMETTQSSAHAMELIKQFNIQYHLFDIKPAVDALTLAQPSNDVATVLSHANIRPRVRMTFLYQLAQIEHRLVIGTSNLSERTVGYFTKWGDGVSDLNPIAMLTKQEIYTLARYLEIPDCIIYKKPSAGLWDGQTDEDELGITYAQIDAYILNGTSGCAEIDRKIEDRIALSAHKHSPVPIFTGNAEF